ncbi:hypothetical protein ABEB36_009255 [Hypothenemus hampei]|uniref:Uncharacterized protein n=1 Tax=Hypothenemus hampei TaxID=57062 RepID=A0ABD1EFT8_HYPHA
MEIKYDDIEDDSSSDEYLLTETDSSEDEQYENAKINKSEKMHITSGITENTLIEESLDSPNLTNDKNIENLNSIEHDDNKENRNVTSEGNNVGNLHVAAEVNSQKKITKVFEPKPKPSKKKATPSREMEEK